MSGAAADQALEPSPWLVAYSMVGALLPMTFFLPFGLFTLHAAVGAASASWFAILMSFGSLLIAAAALSGWLALRLWKLRRVPVLMLSAGGIASRSHQSEIIAWRDIQSTSPYNRVYPVYGGRYIFVTLRPDAAAQSKSRQMDGAVPVNIAMAKGSREAIAAAVRSDPRYRGDDRLPSEAFPARR